MENADSFESEEVEEQSYKISFAATTNERPNEYSCQLLQRVHQAPITSYIEPRATLSVNKSRAFDKEHRSLELAVLSQLQ